MVDAVAKDLATCNLAELRTDPGGIINALLAIVLVLRGAERACPPDIGIALRLICCAVEEYGEPLRLRRGLDSNDLGHQLFPKHVCSN